MDPTPPAFFSYASAGALLAQCFTALSPPMRISTADFAAANRWLFNEGGGYVGLWNHAKAPYLVSIMDALDDTDHTTVAVAACGQTGKNAVAENWLFASICTNPAGVLWYMHTDNAINSYVKKTINPLIEQHEKLHDRLGHKRTDDSLSFKGFTGAPVEFLACNHSNLINKNAPRIVADEFDAYDLNGDPKTLLDVRRSTYGRDSKLYVLSHADRAGGLAPQHWNAGVMALYRDSDCRTWWWPCAQCGLWSSPNPGTRLHMALHYSPDLPSLDDVAASAALACPHNGCLLDDADRNAMNLRGRWIGQGQEVDEETGEVTGALIQTDTAGFWIVGTMSPFVFGGLGGLARARVKAEREAEATGDDESLRQVIVKQWGQPYDPPRQAGSLDAAVLAERADPALIRGVVPHGVRFITAAIDQQGNRFEVLFRGWGVDRESWVIDHRVIRELGGNLVEPFIDGVCWDLLLDQVHAAEFPLADGSGRVMRVKAVAMDTGGGPGATEQAYAAWRRQKVKRAVRYTGLVQGRRTYSLLGLKGGSTLQGARLTVAFPDVERKDRRTAARGEVPLGIFNPNTFKDALSAQLERAQPGAGYVHIPAVFRADKPPHPWFEQLVAEHRQANGAWKKTADNARNEILDLMVMSAVIAHLHAPSRFDWQRPPPWARDWDANPLVGLPAISHQLPEVPPPGPTQAARPAPAQAPTSLNAVPAGRVTPPGGSERVTPSGGPERVVPPTFKQLLANMRAKPEARP